jgi:hypothetical protein
MPISDLNFMFVLPFPKGYTVRHSFFSTVGPSLDFYTISWPSWKVHAVLLDLALDFRVAGNYNFLSVFELIGYLV